MNIGIVMDPIAGINPHKDSSLAMLLAAKRRGWRIWYMESTDLSLRGEKLEGAMRPLTVFDDPMHWFEIGAVEQRETACLDFILMRKDPPVDLCYIHTLLLLGQAKTKVWNHPSSILDANEKLFITRFPDCIAPTLVSASASEITDFAASHQEIVLKPLDAMGGTGVFRSHSEDPNLRVIIEVLTHNGQQFIMAQRFVPEISAGDKRILMIDGKPFPYCLARIPPKGDFRGNLVRGAKGEGRKLTTQDQHICEQVGPILKEMGLSFVGLDVIGDFLSEINVTSPTCIRELDALYAADIAGQLLDRLEDLA
ncbi:MAG: glutathione synthase [Candidatus Eutrophobiaceae bacterium]